MKNLLFSLLAAVFGYFPMAAQSGYSVKLRLKNLRDPYLLLIRYTYNKQYLADTSGNLLNGVGEFSGPVRPGKGVYALVSPSMVKYFDIIINQDSNFTVTGDMADLAHTLTSPDSKENQLMFGYSNFMAAKANEYREVTQQARGKTKNDSLTLVAARQHAINKEVKIYEAAFFQKNKGSFVYDILNLRTEKYASKVPTLKNGRPDSLYQYNYYREHFLDGIDFKDDGIVRTPFFADRIHRYLDQVIIQHPDTVVKVIDGILARCEPGNLAWNSIISDYTFKFEQNSVISFDRHGKASSFESAFVHMADTYITNYKSSGVYDDDAVSKIIRRVNVLRHLLPEGKMPELFLVDTLTAPVVRAMGFDTISSNQSLVNLYSKNSTQLVPLFKTLYKVNAKYTVLVFWAADCDHCKEEMPKLKEQIRSLPGLDVKVVAVQTRADLYEEGKRFIVKNRLHFENLYDPVHMNDLKEKFDISATPMIYLLDEEKRIKGKKLTPAQTAQIILKLESIEKM